MWKCIGCDAHKKYSVFVARDEDGNFSKAVTVSHEHETFRQFLRTLPPGSMIALETIGYWYWIVDEIERAGHHALLTNAKKAKHMMAGTNKTDKLDARGLATLLCNGTLPVVWTADPETRDQRELSRVRMSLVGTRTRLKNRVHACFDRYNIPHPEDSFAEEPGEELTRALEQLPPHTRFSVMKQLQAIADVRSRIDELDARLGRLVKRTPEMALLKSMPGVGDTLSVVIALEIGTVDRFGCAQQLIAYAGLAPRIHSSGGRTRFGPTPPAVNRTLKWAFVEAANHALRGRRRPLYQHLISLYDRVARRHPSAVAKVAMARSLAQSAFEMLKKKEVYKVPISAASRPGSASAAGAAVLSSPRQARGCPLGS